MTLKPEHIVEELNRTPKLKRDLIMKMINEERFCTEGIAEFSLLNMDALNEDGYVVRWNAIQQIGRFFEENIFSTKDYKTARGEKEPDAGL